MSAPDPRHPHATGQGAKVIRLWPKVVPSLRVLPIRTPELHDYDRRTGRLGA